MERTTNEDIILKACKKASKKNPLTKERMTHLTGLPERQNRRIIEKLRDKGERIINNGDGYWYATNKQFAEWLPQYVKGAKTIFRRVAAMNRHTEGQIKMDEWEETTQNYIAELRNCLEEF